MALLNVAFNRDRAGPGRCRKHSRAVLPFRLFGCAPPKGIRDSGPRARARPLGSAAAPLPLGHHRSQSRPYRPR